jgi:hypothetical protein
MYPYADGDWFAIPLRFGLFAVGRAAVVDEHGAILGYFFARVFERLPTGSDILALSPGDADIIGVCDQHGLRSGEWPIIATARACDPRPWAIPVFRRIDPATGVMRWSTVEPTNLRATVPMSWAAVELSLWRCFRIFQNTLHRKYIADMQREITAQAS